MGKSKPQAEAPHILAGGDPRGEFPFAPPDYLFLLINTIARKRDTEMEHRLRDEGVNVARHRAMVIIDRFQPCTMSELSEFTTVERTTLTRTVDQLVEAGYVERNEQPADRRQVLLSLSAAGRAKVAQTGKISWQLSRDILEGIPEEDQRALIRLAQGIAANMADDAVSRERMLTFRRPAKTNAHKAR